MTSDIKPNYLNIARRLQAEGARHPLGFTVMSINILIIDGEPFAWTSPKSTNIEPKNNAQVVRTLIESLSS